jgi:excisionase family DNA binding protein
MIPTLLRPSRSLATLGWTPLESRCVACACRKSWKRMRGRILLRARKRTHSCARLCGRKGEPSACATTKSSSDRRLPPRRTPAACLSRCAPESITNVADKAILRSRPALGSLYLTPALVRSTDGTTANCAPARSTWRQRKAAISPRRSTEDRKQDGNEDPRAPCCFDKLGGLLKVVGLHCSAADLRTPDGSGRIWRKDFPFHGLRHGAFENRMHLADPRRTVQRLIRRRKLRAHHIGPLVRIEDDDIAGLLDATESM